MNINRYNYEEFFLLYVDNELTKAERAEVEAFVHDNADLQEELTMLKQSKLKPDAGIKFMGIESLLKPESAGFINETNYEEFFLLYIDEELSANERREVEAFAAAQPQLQQELNLLLQTKIEGEPEVVFPDKSLLYKEENKKRPVILIWQRVVAVAALLILALGIFWLSGNGKKQNGLATKTNELQGTQQSTASDVAEKKPATEIKAPNNEVTNPANQPQIAQQEKTNKPVKPIRSNDEPQEQKQQLALNDKPVQQELNTQDNTSIITDKALTAAELSGVDKNSAGTINTKMETANTNYTVKAVAQQVSYASYAEEDQGILFANITVDRKNKLRGLFRKVTRVFEKTTSLPASDKEY